MSILDDFERGIGMFGPLAMKHEREMATRLGPALAGVMGTQIRANADVTGAAIGSHTSTGIANMKDIGETLRQTLINRANLDITGIRESGQTARNKYSADMGFAGQKYNADSQLTGVKYGQDSESNRAKRRLKFQEDVLDDMKIDAWKRGGTGRDNPASVIDKLDRGYGAGAVTPRGSSGGGGWGDQLLEEDEGFTY